MEVQIKGNKIFALLRKEWVELTAEEQFKQEFIVDLIDKYNYSIDQIGQDVKVSDSAFVDIAIWKTSDDKLSKKTPAIVIAVDCNPEWHRITKNDAKIKYLSLSVKTDFIVIKNLRETRIYYIDKKVATQDFIDVIEFPEMSAIKNSKSINKFVEDKRESNSKQLFNAALLKCHNIIRNNDKLSPEAAFDEISKILFLKYEYEKDRKGEVVFSKELFLNEEQKYIEAQEALNKSVALTDYMQIRFDVIKDKLKSEKLFDSSEKIKIRRTSFEQILEEFSDVNLLFLDDDIKGLAFESFLSRTFRGELGQFFTPRPVVDFMVKVIDPCEGELICDPCCGSGGFLIAAFNYIREKIEKDIKDVLGSIDKNKTCNQYKLKNLINKEWDKSNHNGRFYNLSQDTVFGTDANPRMARTAKMNMIMHGDGHGGVYHHDGLLNVGGIWAEKFDIILTNPPFGSKLGKEIKIIHEDLPSESNKFEYENRYGLDYTKKVYDPMVSYVEKKQSIIKLFKSGQNTGLTEVLFIERCLNLLKPGGRMGIVLPEGVLNNTNLQVVRDLFESMAKIILITSIPQDVFMASGATVKPSLVFLKKFNKEESDTYNKVIEDAKAEIETKYKSSLSTSNPKDNKDIKKRIENDVKRLVKERFDYQIPIAQVEKAGVTTTGAECDNELTSLLREYIPYRKENKLWEAPSIQYDYKIEGSRLYRKLNDKDWEEI